LLLRCHSRTGIGSDEEISGDEYWHHWSHTVRHADRESLRAADASAAAIADAQNVRYDGWAIVYERTGSLRPASVEDAARLRADDERSFRIARQL
jgi:hypothetical protein